MPNLLNICCDLSDRGRPAALGAEASFGGYPMAQGSQTTANQGDDSPPGPAVDAVGLDPLSVQAVRPTTSR